MSQCQHESLTRRTIRSFVKRSGRLTRSQQHALDAYWPQYGLDFCANRLVDFSSLFAQSDCIKLEIGFGNGDALVEMAGADLGCGYIGIEVHEPGVGHCLHRVNELGLTNLKLVSHDAVEVLESMISASSLDAVFLFFPDPWHKKRHHKRRIVNQHFRDLLVKVMKPGAILHMATDWLDYAEHMAEELMSDSRFRNLGDKSGYAVKPDYRPTTKFERRGVNLGHEVRDLLFRKQ